MDSTHKHLRRSALRALTVISILAIGACSLATQARADGDPASDVLATEKLFLPQDAGLSTSQQLQLASLAVEAERAGYPIRTAVIASPTDLGSISELWRAPQTYAHFLGQELSLIYRGTLLVVMPNGYGVYGVGGVRVDSSALNGLGTPGSDLGTSVIAALRRLAAASGHALPLPTVASTATGGSSDAVPWIVFGIGVALIGAAWTISLRARPLGTREQGDTSA